MLYRRLSAFGRRAVAAAGPSVSDSLPGNLRASDRRTDSFRRSVKTFLFTGVRTFSALGMYWDEALQKLNFTPKCITIPIVTNFHNFSGRHGTILLEIRQ